MKALQVYPIEVQAATGTVNLPYSSGISLIKISTAAPVTLTASFSLNLSAFEIGNDLYVPIYFEGDVTLNTFDFLVAGIAIKQSKLKGKAIFMLFYDAAATSWSLIAETDDNQLPDVIPGENSITAPTSGTVTLVPGVDKNFQRLTGTQTLTGNYTLAFGSGQENDWFYVFVTANITLSGNTLNIGGAVIDAATALAGNYAVYGYCAGGTNWRTIVIGGSLPTSKLQAISANSILGNATNASANPTAIPFAGDGDVLMRDGTSVVAQKLEEKNFGSSLFVLRQAKVSIGSAQILDMFTTPVEILDASGAGRTNILLSVIADNSFGTVAYATNTNVRIYQAGAADNIGQQNGLLGFSTNRLQVIPVPLASGSPTQQYVKNAKTFIQALTGNPTAGDGTITLIITYITID